MTPTDWLLSHDTGISSKLICAVMTGSTQRKGFDAWTPSDPDDFGRCYRLLKHFPSWVDRLDEVGRHYPRWKPLIDAWPELTAMYEQICEPDGSYTKASCEKNEAVAKAMYARMCQLEGRFK